MEKGIDSQLISLSLQKSQDDQSKVGKGLWEEDAVPNFQGQDDLSPEETKELSSRRQTANE